MATYYVGWDVGAWKTKSKDAFVVLSDKADFKPLEFRGSASDKFFGHETLHGYMNDIFTGKPFEEDCTFCFSIDAMFGWPSDFVKMVSDQEQKFKADDKLVKEGNQKKYALGNPYLFRLTEFMIGERKLEKRKNPPMSGVKDEIGQHSTKAMHFLRKYKFTPDENEVAIWSVKDRDQNPTHTAMETYPGAIRTTAKEKSVRKSEFSKDINDWFPGNDEESKERREEARKVWDSLIKCTHEDVGDDIYDAMICALIAKWKGEGQVTFRSPPPEHTEQIRREGWIWLPEFFLGNTL